MEFKIQNLKLSLQIRVVLGGFFIGSSNTLKTSPTLQLSVKTGVERKAVSAIVETFMETIKASLEKGENVYLRELKQ